MGNLDNAESLGGVFVTIGGDDSKLVSDFLAVKQKIAAAEKEMVVRPRFDFQEQQVRDRMGQLIRDMRQQAQNAKIELEVKTRLFGGSGSAIGIGGNLGIGAGPAGFGESSYAAARSSRMIGLPEVTQVRQHMVAVGAAVRDEIGRLRQETSTNPLDIIASIVAERGRSSSNSSNRKGTGGGHGGLSNKNLLSLRGLENSGLVGTATGAYAIIEALNLSADFAEASTIRNHPERITRQYDRIGSAYNAFGDPAMAGNARAQADIAATQKSLGAVESIPIVGAFVRIYDALGNISASLEADAAALKRAAEIHVASVEFSRGSVGRIEGLRGNKIGEAVAQDREAQRAAIEDIRRSGGDPAAYQRLKDVQIEGQVRVNRAAYAMQGEQIVSQYETMASRKERQAIEAQAAGRGDEAFRLQQEADELRARGGRQGAIHAGTGTENSGMINAGAVASEDRAAAQRRLAATRRDQETGYAIAGSRGSTASNVLRLNKQDFPAELQEFDSQAQVRLQKMKDQGERLAVIAAEEDRLRSERAVKVYDHERDLSNRVGQIRDSAVASNLRRQGEGFKAELTMFDGQARRRIALIQDAGEREAATVEYRVGRAAMIAGERNSLRAARTTLEARFGAAALMLDKSLFSGIQAERGDILRMGAAGSNEILSAPANLREQVRKTVIQELRAKKEELTGIEGGGIAQEVEYGTEVIGDPLGISGLALRNKKLNAEIDAQITAAERVNPNQGNDLLEGIKTLLGNILEKISPAGVF